MLQEKELSKQNGGSQAMSAQAAAARVGWIRDWPRWTPYAALAWSLVYAALGLYWALGGRGFPFDHGLVGSYTVPMAGRLGPVAAWVVVITAGLPAVLVGTLMLRGVRRLRFLLISAGVLFTGIFLLLMTDLTLLTTLAYIPFVVFKFITGDDIAQVFMNGLIQWPLVHQLLCLIGGFIWLAATVSYARRSGDACLYCGRRDGPEGWTSPSKAARWSRTAVYVAMAVPVIYAVTRYAWAVGIPLGMTEEHLRAGQESGMWVAGLFLANVGLVGAVLMLGLVQRWGEVFPRWMIGLAGRRVPIALAVVPASIMAVLFMVGGISIWSSFPSMAATAETVGENVWIVVGPTLLFPVWGVALAVATLGYYLRRRGPCGMCGRGELSQPTQQQVKSVV